MLVVNLSDLDHPVLAMASPSWQAAWPVEGTGMTGELLEPPPGQRAFEPYLA